MRSVRSDLTQFGFGGESGSGGLVTRIEALEENVELLEDDVDKAFSQMNYSTQEHVIGEWIDGAPLFEKTFTITITHSRDQHEYDIEIDNNLSVHEINGVVRFTSGNCTTLGGFNGVNGAASIIPIIKLTTSTILIDTYEVDRRGTVCDITIRYTKSE